ncbi:hypothetical protein [Burkholderia cepacia]|nr:hypothetical protein [Burkholderia cepacia]
MNRLEKVEAVQRATGADALTAQSYLEAEDWIVWCACESICLDRGAGLLA